MNIAGSGALPQGEYDEKIATAGSARILGNIKCQSLDCAGSASGDGDIDCVENCSTAGSFTLKGSVTAGKKAEFSGSATLDGGLKCQTLKTAGSFRCGAGIEAETARIRGAIDCGGLLNAETIDIRFRSQCHVASLGGGTITVIPEESNEKSKRRPALPLFKRLTERDDRADGVLTVDESVEGDTVALESVAAPLVIGRVVAIGAGCRIDTVRYTEELEISPDASVTHIEKTV